MSADDEAYADRILEGAEDQAALKEVESDGVGHGDADAGRGDILGSAALTPTTRPARSRDMIYLRCPKCKARSNRDGFNARGQYCYCGWRRDTTTSATLEQDHDRTACAVKG